jgi:hypothetical protein
LTANTVWFRIGLPAPGAPPSRGVSIRPNPFSGEDRMTPKSYSRPSLLQLEDLAEAARLGVSLAIEDRNAALASISLLDPNGTMAASIFEPSDPMGMYALDP